MISATVAKAIASCADRNEIRLRSGSYTGAGNRDVLVFRKTVSFVSDTGSEIVLDVQNQGRFLNLRKSIVSITGLRFQNGQSLMGGAIFASDSTLTLIDVVVTLSHFLSCLVVSLIWVLCRCDTTKPWRVGVEQYIPLAPLL